MAEELETENASWERTGKDLVAGAAGGIAQVLLGGFSWICICLSVCNLKSICNEKLLYFSLDEIKRNVSVAIEVLLFFFFSDFLFRQFLWWTLHTMMHFHWSFLTCYS